MISLVVLSLSIAKPDVGKVGISTLSSHIIMGSLLLRLRMASPIILPSFLFLWNRCSSLLPLKWCYGYWINSRHFGFKELNFTYVGFVSPSACSVHCSWTRKMQCRVAQSAASLCSICPNLSAGVRPVCKEVFCPAWAVKNSLHSSLFAQIVISGYCTIRYLQNGFSGSVFCSAWSLPMAWIGSKQISKFCLHTQYTITQKSKSKSKTLGVL